MAISAKANALLCLVLNDGEVALARFSVNIKQLLFRVNMVKVQNIRSSLSALGTWSFQGLYFVVVFLEKFALSVAIASVIPLVIRKNLFFVLCISFLYLILGTFFANRIYSGLTLLVGVKL